MSMWISAVELQSLLGKDMARVLMQWHGGVGLYIPKTATAQHMLTRVVGLCGMRALCSAYGGETVTVPNGRTEPHKAKIIALLEEGTLSKSAIAAQVGATERYVYMVAESTGTGTGTRQLGLPLDGVGYTGYQKQ